MKHKTIIGKTITENDLFGRFYLRRLPNEGPYRNYYASIDAVRPLLEREAWQEYVTGYYINAYTGRDAVRLSYFTNHPEETVKTIRDFLAKNNMDQPSRSELPHAAKIAELYGGEELRFRKFLNLYTRIGLDLLEGDRLYARRLFILLRYRFMKMKQPYEEYLKDPFEENSKTYRLLTDKEKKQLWKDLNHWPNPPQMDWMHMMVNMILGWDVNSTGKWREFIESPQILMIPQINEIIKDQGFRIEGIV